MKYLAGLVILIGTSMISSSCIKHEVIPAPEEMVELPASFSASLNGNSYELINDVNGYFCKPAQFKQINPAPQSSTVIYTSSIQSAEKLDYIKIGIGMLEFNSDTKDIPTLTEFTDYFDFPIGEPVFSDYAIDGVEITYRDANNGVWYSDENMLDPQSFNFTSVSQESDEEGDYLIFTATFSASLVDDRATPTDTIRFDNATFKGYFKR